MLGTGRFRPSWSTTFRGRRPGRGGGLEHADDALRSAHIDVWRTRDEVSGVLLGIGLRVTDRPVVVPCFLGQLTLRAVSSMTKDVCLVESSLPVNLSVMFCPA